MGITRDDMRGVEPHPIQVRLAFGGDSEQPAEIAELVGRDDATLTLRSLRDGTCRDFVLTDLARLEAVLHRPDVCRLASGNPLALVNGHYRLCAIAIGPACLPDQLVANNRVVRLDNGVAVEMPSASPDQPSWHIFAVEVAPAAADADGMNAAAPRKP